MRKLIKFIIAWTVGVILLPFVILCALFFDFMDWLFDMPYSSSFEHTLDVFSDWWCWASFQEE